MQQMILLYGTASPREERLIGAVKKIITHSALHGTEVYTSDRYVL